VERAAWAKEKAKMQKQIDLRTSERNDAVRYLEEIVDQEVGGTIAFRFNLNASYCSPVTNNLRIKSYIRSLKIDKRQSENLVKELETNLEATKISVDRADRKSKNLYKVLKNLHAALGEVEQTVTDNDHVEY
jgi:hypothetical protein